VTVVLVASWALIIAGTVFALIGALGLFRLPDFYTRTHAASITDSAGASLLLLGLLLQAESFAVGIRLLLIMLFLLFTSPTAAHALAQAALKDGLKPVLGRATLR